MKHKEVISNWQQTLLIIGFLFGNSLIYSMGIRYTERDTFLAEIISGFLSAIILLAIAWIVNLFPDKDPYQIIQIKLGSIAAKLFLIPFFLFSLFVSVLILDDMQAFMVTLVMEDTPPWVFIITLSLATAWVVRHGLEVIARCAELTMPIVLGLFIILLILLLPRIKLIDQLPLFTTDLTNLFKSTIVIGSFPFMEIILILFVATKVKETKKLYKNHIFAICIATFFLSLRSILAIDAFGVSEGTQYIFTMYQVTRVISFGQFFERVEILFLALFFFTIFIKLAIGFYVSANCLANILSIRNYTPLIMPLAIFTASLTLNNYGNYQEKLIFQFVSWPIIVFFIVSFFLVFCILAFYTLIKS